MWRVPCHQLAGGYLCWQPGWNGAGFPTDYTILKVLVCTIDLNCAKSKEGHENKKTASTTRTEKAIVVGWRFQSSNFTNLFAGTQEPCKKFMTSSIQSRWLSATVDWLLLTIGRSLWGIARLEVGQLTSVSILDIFLSCEAGSCTVMIWCEIWSLSLSVQVEQSIIIAVSMKMEVWQFPSPRKKNWNCKTSPNCTGLGGRTSARTSTLASWFSSRYLEKEWRVTRPKKTMRVLTHTAPKWLETIWNNIYRMYFSIFSL